MGWLWRKFDVRAFAASFPPRILHFSMHVNGVSTCFCTLSRANIGLQCVAVQRHTDILLFLWTQPLVGGAVWWSKRWLELSGGLLTCLNMYRCCAQAFDLASGNLLACLIPVYSYMFDRWYPDMFWHVWCPTMQTSWHLTLPWDSTACGRSCPVE